MPELRRQSEPHPSAPGADLCLVRLVQRYWPCRERRVILLEPATWRQHCGPVAESCACQTWDHDEDYALLLEMFIDAGCVDAQTFMHLLLLLTLFAEDP